jgi:YXWGXW repeat-containing protein
MLNRKILFAGAVAASLASFTLPAVAAASVYIDIAPPAPRIEHFDARPGYVVAPGYWGWKNGKHHWVEGRYVAERKGYRYENDRWVQHDNNKWTMQRGGWSRDSDGDGVPDRQDNHPNNPHKQ